MRSFDSANVIDCSKRCAALSQSADLGLAYFDSESTCVCAPAEDFFKD